MNFGQLVSQVQMTFQSVYPDRLDDDLIKMWVNQGIQELDAAISWTRTAVEDDSVTDQYAYDFPADAIHVLYITYLSDGEEKARLLEQCNFEDWLRRGESSGTPTRWCMFGGEVFLWPTPDTDDETITFYITKTPAALTTNTTSPTLPSYLHNLIVDYALSQAYIHVGDSNAAMAYEQKYQLAVQRWIADAMESRIGEVSIQDREPVD